MSDYEQDNESGADAAPTPPAANFGIGPAEPTIQPSEQPPAAPDAGQPADAAVAAAQPGGQFAPPGGEFGQQADQLGSVAPGPRRKTGLIIGAAAAVAVIVVVAVVFVVTGGSGPGQSPAQAIATAERVSAQITSATGTFSEQAGNGTTISGTATFQRSPLVVEENLTEAANGQSIPITAIVTPNAMYLKSSVLLKGSPKPWVKIPLAELGPGSVFSSLLHSLQNENPMSQTRLFLAAQHVRAAGQQVISGVGTTKYTGSFAPLAALKYLSPSTRSVMRPLLGEITGDVHFTIWIAANNQIRKFTEIESVQTQTVTTSVTYNSFDQPVTITIPPASQVAIPPASALNGSA
jgi:hypothetical protein